MEFSVLTTDHGLEIERQILGALIHSPDLLRDAVDRLKPDDFEHAVHRSFFDKRVEFSADDRLLTIIDAGRLLGGVAELEPDLTGEDYADMLTNNCMMAEPKSFALNVSGLLDRAARRHTSSLGDFLKAAEGGAPSIVKTLSAATEALSRISASVRQVKSHRYSSTQASVSVLDDFRAKRETNNVTTGLTGLDDLIGGFPRGQLSIMAARPGMGKSASIVSGARRAAHAGSASLIFSLEMTQAQVGARLLTDECYSTMNEPIEYEAILNRKLEPDGRNLRLLEQAVDRMKDLPLFFDEQRGITVLDVLGRIETKIDELRKTGMKLDTVYIDHIGLIKASDRYAGIRHREISEITDTLATAAKDLDIAIVGMCQLNRGVETRDNKRPSLSDLRDSGSIEEDASLVVFLYRPAYYLELMGVLEDHDAEMARLSSLAREKNTIEYIVAKNRNGRGGTAKKFIAIGSNAIRKLSFHGG